MDYAEFKDHLAVFLWKQNDVDLLSRMDSLIVMANHELRRKLNLQRREPVVALPILGPDTPLPADLNNVVSVTPVSPYGVNPLSETLPSAILGMRRSPHASITAYPYYAVRADGPNKFLMLAVEDDPVGVSVSMQYRLGIPDFAVSDASWVCDEYLDAYTYTVLSHTAPFLREDERVPLWMDMKNDALASAIDEDAHKMRFGGSPLHMRPHHYVP